MGTIKDLIAYRRRYDARIWASLTREVMSDFGPFRRIVFRDGVTETEHVALVRGKPCGSGPMTVYLEVREVHAAWIDESLSDPQGALAQALFAQADSDTAVLLMLNLHGRSEATTLSVRQLNEVYARGSEVVSQMLEHLQVACPLFSDVDTTHMQVALAA